jgi:uncharacterized protein (DUF169 family)
MNLEGNTMSSISDLNKYGEELQNLMLLRTTPIAVKMLEKEEDIPEGAIRPSKDRGEHIAQCQAFALSRRQRETIAMLEEDNWCFAPVIAYGLEDKPEDKDLQAFLNFPRFPRDKYIGIVSAPLRTANFLPDVVLIYSDTGQLRNMLMPLNYQEERNVDYNFFPPACAFQVVPVMNSGRYMVTLPDPGDRNRALAGNDEIILSVPAARMEELVVGLLKMKERGFMFDNNAMFMLHDFPRPEFYWRLFRRWGLAPQPEEEEAGK